MAQTTIGSLIDELSIANIKIYHLIDVIEQEKDDSVVAEASRKTAKLNRERSRLINQIDELLTGEGVIIKT